MPGCRAAERRALERLRDQRDVEALVVDPRDGQRDAVDGDRALLDDVAQQRRGAGLDRHDAREAVLAHARRPSPTPSTWPCTMWPPRRSAARSGSSRFTARAGARSPPSGERRSVSCMTSAPKRSPSTAVAVRQTPLTATESPSPSSPASARRERQAHAVGGRVRPRRPSPRSCDEPGEHAAHHSLQPRGDQQVVADALAVERQRAQRVGDALDALALERVARGAAAEQQRREEQADLVDLAGVEERARQVRAALEQDRRRRRSAPSWSSAERTRAGSFSPVATMTSAPAISSASVAARGAARETTTVSGSSGAAATSCESSGRRAVESKTTRRGWRWTPSTRAVSCGSSASAVPMPTATASTLARQRCARARLDSSEIHFESPVPRGDLAVERHRRLEQHPRPAGARVLAEGLVEQPRARGELAVGDVDLDALVAQDPQAAAGRPSRSGRRRRRRRALMPGGDDRVGARRRLAVVTARLQRDVQRRAGRRSGAVGGGDRVDLGVRAAVLLVPALAERPRRRGRAPRRPSGWGARARARTRASSIARARCSRSCRVRAAHRAQHTRPSRSARLRRRTAARSAPPVQAVDRHLRARAGGRPAGSSRTSSRS